MAQDVYVPPTFELGHDDVQRARPAHYVSPGLKMVVCLQDVRVHICKMPVFFLNSKGQRKSMSSPKKGFHMNNLLIKISRVFLLWGKPTTKNSEAISSVPSSVDRSNGIGRNATRSAKSRSRSRRRKSCQRPRQPRPEGFSVFFCVGVNLFIKSDVFFYKTWRIHLYGFYFYSHMES